MTLAGTIPVSVHPDLARPRRSLALPEADLGSWLESAEPGARIEYHRGHLVIDRTRGFSPFGERLRCELDAIADRALALADEGRLLLVQEHHGDCDFSYFAIKTKHAASRGGV